MKAIATATNKFEITSMRKKRPKLGCGKALSETKWHVKFHAIKGPLPSQKRRMESYSPELCVYDHAGPRSKTLVAQKIKRRRRPHAG